MASAPVSLYLELKPGETADLEVVARASLALVAAIKDITYHLDPLSDVRVELQSGDEGSLELKAWVREKRQKYINPKTVLAATIVFALYFKDEVKEHIISKGLDYLFPGFVEESFSDAEKKELREIIDEALKKHLGHKEAAQVYRELDKDPAVSGVGATTKPGTKPASIVPKSDFKRRAGDAPVIESEVRKRESDPTFTVTLIKPVLEHSKRSWRLKAGDVEFGAVMQDQEFLDNVLSEKIKVPMVEGIQLNVTLHIEEEFTPLGVWEVKSRKITKVHSFNRAPSQPSLLSIPQLRASIQGDEDEDN